MKGGKVGCVLVRGYEGRVWEEVYQCESVRGAEEEDYT